MNGTMLGRRRLGNTLTKTLIAILVCVLVLPIAYGQLPIIRKVTQGHRRGEFFAGNVGPSRKQPSLQQTTSQNMFYVESWKQGSVQVREQIFHLEFCNQDQEYTGVVSDIQGKARYRFLIVPLRTKLESGFNGWNIELHQAGSRGSLDSLLRTGRGQGDSFSKKDNLGLLYPEENPGIQTGTMLFLPLSATRVIKVESFYCIIQVKGYTLLPKHKGLASIAIDVELTNTYTGPRNSM